VTTARTASPETQREAGVAPPKHPPYLAWSLPAALCLVFGIALAGWGSPLWSSVALAAVFLIGMIARGYRVLALVVVLVPLGFARYTTWEAQPERLSGLLGQEVTLSGESDGTYLTLDDPAGAKVVLSPRGEVGAGRVTVRGDLARPSDKRNPGGFDYEGYLERRGVEAQLFVDEVLSFEPAAVTFKERLRRGVVAGLSEQNAALMEAMTLGLRDNLDGLRDSFAASGLAHILALSGLNFGVLIATLSFLLRPLGVLRYPVMIAFVVGFVLLVDASPSVLRAGAMAAALLASLWLGAGRLEPWPALSLAALFALLWNPSGLFDLSFQLSYLAVMGMLLFAAPVLRLLRAANLPWWHPKPLLLGTAGVSLAAQALVLPLLAHTFGTVPLLSPLVNVAAIPLATLLVPLGFAAGVLGLVSTPLAELLNALTAPVASGLIRVAETAAPWPSLFWGEVAPVGFLLYGVGALAAALVAQGKLRAWRGLLVVAAAVGSSMLTRPPHPAPEIVYMDVGQGDSSLIRLPGRVEILVDGGGTPFSDFDVGARTVVPALRALGVDELELVVATHADTDHIEGLVSVLKLMPVRGLVIGHAAPDSEVFRALLTAAEGRGVPVMQVRRGEALELGGARLDVLNPPMKPFEEDNDNSVAFVLNWQGMPRALFLGDVSSEVEAALAVPDVDVLMAAHHGSRFSTSEALVAAAQPELAVLSYGRNGYGHPHPDVLARLHGARVHHTKREGALRVPLSP